MSSLSTRSNLEMPTVSVLVSTRDRRLLLDRLLDSLRRQDYPADRWEVVVVEETDQPRPPEGVRYVPIPRENLGYAHTRNVALGHATGQLVAFTDDDCVASDQWLRELIAPLAADPSVAGVAGAVRVNGGSLLGECEYILGFPGGGLRYETSKADQAPTVNLSTCNCAYRKEAVLEVGGFQGGRYGGEDELLGRAVAQRGRCIFNPQAIVHHQAHGSLGEIFSWFARRGRSEIGLAALADRRALYLSRVALGSLTLKSAAAAGLLGMLALFWPTAALVLSLAFPFLYYMLLLYRYRYARRRCRWTAWLAVPLVRVVMDLGQDWGRFKAILQGLYRR